MTVGANPHFSIGLEEDTMCHHFRMSFTLAVLISLLTLPLMTAFTTLGLVNALAMTGVAASVGGGKALCDSDSNESPKGGSFGPL